MSETKAVGRIILVDPAFSNDRLGHHWRLNSGYAKLIDREKCEFATHISLKRAPEIDPDRIIPTFSISHYDEGELRRLGRWGQGLQALAYRDSSGSPRWLRIILQSILRIRRRLTPTETKMESLSSGTSLYRDELQSLIENQALGPDDHLVFLSLDAEMGRSLIELMTEQGLAHLPAFHLRLVYEDKKQISSDIDFYDLIEKLKSTNKIGSRINLYSETDIYTQILSRRLGVQIDVAPFPATSLPPPRPFNERALTVSFLGEARVEKGFDLLTPLMNAFVARHPDLHKRVVWRHQAGGETIEATSARDRIRGRAERTDINVRYCFGTLSVQDYEKIRAEADIVLALQDPAVYALRGSGVGQEALAGGRPLVCRQGSSIALDKAGAVLSGETLEELADAIAQIVRSPEPWFKRAAKEAKRFKDRLEKTTLSANCSRSAPRLPDPPIALLVGPWPLEQDSERSIALQATALTELGYQIVRIRLVRPGIDLSDVQATWRGHDRDSHAIHSLAVSTAPGPSGPWEHSPIPVAVSRILQGGRVRLIVANLRQTATWAARLVASSDPVRVIAIHSSSPEFSTDRALKQSTFWSDNFDAAVVIGAADRDQWVAVGQPNTTLLTPPIDGWTESEQSEHYRQTWAALLAKAGASPPGSSRQSPKRV